MTKDFKSDRWSCPNDRNLQLRSKLNAGWSYFTDKKTAKKDPQLTENELIEIQKVIQRSEMLERNERERVLKLVDRLENLKRNTAVSGPTNGNSQNRCALCGDYFYILRSFPNQCGSCHKTLCNKCCIDTQFTVQNNSTYGSSSNFSTHQSRRNSSASNSSNQSTKVVVYLCRLCSEQREFLKKSGAWFLKKCPSYVENNEKYNSTSNLSQIEKSTFENADTNNNTSVNNQKGLSHASPFNIRRNFSSMSANSPSFRFWKTKETFQSFFTGQNSVNSNSQNNEIDNLSMFSAENDAHAEFNSNYDSVTTRTASSENVNIKTPTSPALLSAFNFNMTNVNNSNNSQSNNSPTLLHPKINNVSNLATNVSNNSLSHSNNSSPTNLKANELNQSKSDNTSAFFINNSNSPCPNNQQQANEVEKTTNITPTITKKSNINLDPNASEDDDADFTTESSMSSYNYYSNIISNLKPNASNLSNLSNPNDSMNLNNKSNNNINNNNNLNSSSINKSNSNVSNISNLSNTSNKNINSNPISLSTSKNDNLKRNDSNNSIKKSSNTFVISNKFKSANNDIGTINAKLYSTSPTKNGTASNTNTSSFIADKNMSNKNFDLNNDNNNTKNNLNHSFLSLNGLDKDDGEINNNEVINGSTRLKSSSSIRTRSFRKPKLFEWCSTQLSIDSEESDKKGSNFKSAKQSLSNYISKKKHSSSIKLANGSSSSHTSSFRSSQASLNNITKKMLSNQHDNMGNNDTMNTVAASSSMAVASAASLTTSLNKLNFK